MITVSDMLNFNVYKKEVHTGSDRGMRFQIGAEEKESTVVNSQGEEEIKKEKLLAVYVWPEPFSFDKTNEALKIKKEFPFSVEGQKAAMDWLNQIREEKDEYWEKHKGIMWPLEEDYL